MVPKRERFKTRMRPASRCFLAGISDFQSRDLAHVAIRAFDRPSIVVTVDFSFIFAARAIERDRDGGPFRLEQISPLSAHRRTHSAYLDAIGTEWRKRTLESELAGKWRPKRRTFDASEAHRFAADVYKEMAFNGLKSAVRIANVRELDNGRLELDFCAFALLFFAFFFLSPCLFPPIFFFSPPPLLPFPILAESVDRAAICSTYRFRHKKASPTGTSRFIGVLFR